MTLNLKRAPSSRVKGWQRWFLEHSFCLPGFVSSQPWGLSEDWMPAPCWRGRGKEKCHCFHLLASLLLWPVLMPAMMTTLHSHTTCQCILLQDSLAALDCFMRASGQQFWTKVRKPPKLCLCCFLLRFVLTVVIPSDILVPRLGWHQTPRLSEVLCTWTYTTCTAELPSNHLSPCPVNYATKTQGCHYETLW